MENRKIKKILIFALCGMGDLIMLTPTITSLKKSYQGSKISVVIRNRMARQVLENNPYVDEILNYPEDFMIKVWTKWFASKNKIHDIKNLVNELKFLLQLRKKKFDLSIWAFPGESKRGALVSLISGAKIKMGQEYRVLSIDTCLFYDYCTSIGPKTHAVDDNLDYLRKLGAKRIINKLYLKIPEKYTLFAKKFLKNKGVSAKNLIIGIHPGCDKANSYRRWPVENFVRLAKELNKDNNKKIIVFEGPDEEGILHNFDELQVIEAKNMPFYEIAALIKECQVMITSDSGLGHIAAALNVPTITLFGPANPNKTRPYQNNGIVLKKLDDSFYTDKTKLNSLMEEGRKALERITVEEVLEALNNILN